jgi:hypothetical protein
MKLLLSMVILAGSLLAQTKFSGPPNIPSGTSLPASCVAGDTFIKSDATAGQNVYVCIGTTWTQQASAGGSVACDPFSRTGNCIAEEFSGGVAGTVFYGNIPWTIGASSAYAPDYVDGMIGIAKVSSAYSANNSTPGEIWHGLTGFTDKFMGSTAAMTNTELWFRILSSSITGKKFYCGLADAIGAASGSITKANTVRIKFDSADVATFKAETCAASTCSTSVTNMPSATAAEWWWLKIRWGATAGTIYFSVANGTGAFSTETSIAANLPTASTYVGCQIVNSTDGGGSLSIDKFMSIHTDVR